MPICHAITASGFTKHLEKRHSAWKCPRFPSPFSTQWHPPPICQDYRNSSARQPVAIEELNPVIRPFYAYMRSAVVAGHDIVPLWPPSGSAPPLIPPINLSAPACYRESSCRPGHSQEPLAGAYSSDLAVSEVRGTWLARDFPHLLPICPPVSPSIEESYNDLQFLPLRPAYLASRNVSQSP
jgi:hypothetical protein